MEESSLPRASALSPRLLLFLEDHFKKRQDLYTVPPLLLNHLLKDDCSRLHRHMLELNSKLSSSASQWISRSDAIRRTSSALHAPPPPPLSSSLDANANARSMLDVELPQLVRQVACIDTIRCYAETALKLEALVGDLEDATLSIMSRTTRNNITANLFKSSDTTDREKKQEKLLHALKAMKAIEEILVDIAKSRPHWSRLLMAVDSRVEKALTVLRPQALTDHRVLLSSLGWPPSLLTSNAEKDKCLEILNPLVLMQGEKKEKYSQSFLALCALQHLQTQRESRQHEFLRYPKGYKLPDLMDIGKPSCLRHGIWVIDELVYPIAARMEYHFSCWSNKPEFTFALVYKITRDFLDGVDNILQPIIDKAMIIGCSAKEAWVSGMMKMLSKYLEGEVFPALARHYKGADEKLEVSSSWLHYVDLMTTYDMRMRTLATTGTPIKGPFYEFEGVPGRMSLLSVFDEHPDWLQIWAKIELKDAEDKLKLEIDLERSWSIVSREKNQLANAEETESFILSSRLDSKAPLIADSVVRISWTMIERALSLPSKLMRIQFIRSSATLFLNHFFISLLQRCRDVDITSAVLEDDELLTVIGSVNAAKYCESVLQQWNDDISFLEMGVANDNQHRDASFFEDEIMFLVKLGTDSLVEIMSGILLQFDALCWKYIQNIEHLGEENIASNDKILEERNLSISPEFMYALEMLRDRMEIFRLNLNSQDFVDLWRSIADGLDHFIFSSISASNVRFSVMGVHQFKVDMGALLLIFSPFCSRPEAFFPCISDSLKLLALGFEEVNHLLQVFSEGTISVECLRARGLFHVSVGQAERILRNRRL
ncbi:RINT1-like protein MAG2L [Iris pallida]|uniref:RINT1-like protein MAG2L n=1 Tax=Iris pallida TaxID=29817 RepID=A0AAX6FZG2_IRIPA|nr:RINT1-like protein MAG2L [Iris pallida]